MASDGTAAALRELLTELKRRSGLSYEQLGRKAHLSRSTVHRYCSGRSVPSTFAPVEAIATACQADRDDLAKLYRLWERADLAREAVQEQTVEEPDEETVEEPAGDEVSPARPWRTRRRAVTAVAVVAVAAAAATAVALSGGGNATPPRRGPSNDPPLVAPPMWTSAPRLLEPEFVGVTANSNTGQMPTFRVGSVRLWNSRTRWQNIEPERLRYEWETLDRLVEGARGSGLPVVFTFGGTPSWASPNGPLSVFNDGSRTDPPENLADWERFVRDVAVRYRGRIGAYELWDMANHPAMFSGSMAEMVEMTRLASRAIRSADPAAFVVCPSMGELWDPEALEQMRRFGELGGYRHCGAAAVKLSARTDDLAPETMLPLAHEIDKVLHSTRTGIDLWSTGSAYDVNTQRQLDDEQGARHAARFFLSGLYAGYRRMYFYNWGSAKIPIVLQPVGGPHTKAARYVDRLHEWLTGSRIHSCGQGREAGLPDDLWQCRFDRDGRVFLIWWTIDRELRIPAAPGTTSVERLDGSSASVQPDADLTVTGTPILLRLG